MKNVFLLAAACFIVVGILISTMWESPEGNLIVSSDKQEYSSGEIMEVSISYDSFQSIDDVQLSISGIENRYGSYVMNVVDVINLSFGNNDAKYTMKLPSCSSCSGISPGDYQIYVTLKKDDSVIANKTLSFHLQ
jgi:hypothetical protein